jgi:hypothetical protein
MSRLLINCLFVLFFPSSLFSQKAIGADSSKAERSVHLELGGVGGLWSLNMERSLGRNQWYFQYGITYLPTGTHHVFTSPLLIKKVFGQKNHRLETGIGQGFSLAFQEGKPKVFARGILLTGWRYQKEESPWIFRAFYSPLISYLVDLQYQHWAGIGVGLQLNFNR